MLASVHGIVILLIESFHCYDIISCLHPDQEAHNIVDTTYSLVLETLAAAIGVDVRRAFDYI